MIIALVFPALILSLNLSDSSSESGPTVPAQASSQHSVMVVHYAYMACQWRTGAYFTIYPADAVHYARSVACHQSLRGIATVHDIVKKPTISHTISGGWGAARIHIV